MAVVKYMERIFAGRYATAVIFVLSIAARLLQLLFFYNPRVDASYQLMAAKNLLAGQGVSLDTVAATDLSQVIFTPLINWPPGYSFLVAPFMWLFGNYMVAAMVLDAIMAIMLLVICRQVLNLLQVPLFIRNFGLLLMGFYIYFFYLIASSDAIAIPFFLAAFLIVLKIIVKKSVTATTGFLLILFLLIFASIKYLFMPVACVPPLILLIAGYKQKQYVITRTGWISLAFVVVGTTLILLYQKTTGGAAVYVSQPERGFYPQHLLEAYPFIPAAVLKPETITDFIPSVKKPVYILFQVLHVFALALLTIYLVKRLKQNIHKPSFIVWFTALLVSLCITVVLAFLSIMVAKEEILPGWFWTYLEEPRYYGLAIVMLQLCILAYCSEALVNQGAAKKWAVLFLILFIPEIGRGIIFTANRISAFGTEEYSWQYENRFQKAADSILHHAIKPGEMAVVSGSSYYMNHRVNLFSKIPILADDRSLNDLSSLRTSRPVLLLVILQDKELSAYQSFLQSTFKEERGRFADFNFYIVHVSPGK